nr:polysaccharide biosynthesis C-terminal domain-containing protein [Sphaerisporangium corydalis]
MSATAPAGRRDVTATRLAHLLLTRLTLVVAGGLTSVIVARALGPGDRGAYRVIVTIAITAAAMGNLSVEKSQTALWEREGDRPAIEANALWLGLAVGAAAAAFTAVLTARTAVDRSTLVWGLVAVPVMMATVYVNNVHILRSRTEIVNRGSLAGAALQCSALAALALPGWLTVEWVVIIWTLSVVVNLLLLLPALPVCRPRGRTLAARTLSRGLRYHPGYVCHFLMLRLDILVLNAMSTPAAVGVYSMAVTPAELLRAMTGAVVQVTLPRQMESSRETAAAYTARTIRITAVLAAVSIVLFCLAGPPLVVAAAGPAYAGCVVPMLVLAPGVAAAATAAPAAAYLLRLDRPLRTSVMYGGALLANLALNVVLIPRAGVAGCALASTVAYTGLAAAQMGWFARSAGVPLRRLAPGAAEVREIARRLRGFLPARPPEQVLVAAEPAPARLEAQQAEVVTVGAGEDLLGFRDLERIAAHPVEHVVPARHAARPGGRAGGVAGEQPGEGEQGPGPVDVRRARGDQGAPGQRPRPVVAPLHGRPDPAAAPLVVVDRDEQQPAGGHEPDGGVERPPHCTGVVQDAPGVHHVEGPQPGEVAAVQDRSPLDRPGGAGGEGAP